MSVLLRLIKIISYFNKLNAAQIITLNQREICKHRDVSKINEDNKQKIIVIQLSQ